MDIRDMKPGKELDALVAVRVLGWQRWTCKDIDGKEIIMIVPPLGDERHNWGAIWNENGCPSYMPDYSKRISAAWEVVERFKGYCYLYQYQEWLNGKWECKFLRNNERLFYGIGETAPEAICKAALLAKEYGLD